MSEERESKKVVVFGAGGFIGSVLTQLLGNMGWDVRPMTRNECDMASAESMAQAVASLDPGMSAVLCASISRVQEDSIQSFLENIMMAENFAAAARPGQFRSIIFLSSTDVYGNKPICPLTERTLTEPAGYYALSKFASERILSNSENLDCPIASLRLPGIFGPTDDGKSILGLFAKRIVTGQTIRLFGDGSTLRDFVLVDDLCSVILALLNKPYNGVLNIAAGKSHKLIDILQLMAEKAGCELIIQREPPGERSNDLVFDVSAMHGAVGPLYMTPLETGINRLIKHVKERIGATC
ncbi:NAD-dependent epimerase/dehydratase family protein [Desulfovibrio inopinatus]|uniref:NAD-dependent epimerase/dehydratase family protein n=1 Tax=Desulfovibrio inopinatus TaxID=102109 RepID=UPI0003FBCC9D|nr:NAD(P)-dependent oxidoreductase [Desulfovibrio inopinatus]